MQEAATANSSWTLSIYGQIAALDDGVKGVWSLSHDGVAEALLQALAVIGAFILLIGALCVWWYIVWQSNLRDLPIAQELMGKRRQTQEQKDKIAEEIREIKRVHRKKGPSLETARQASLSRRVRYPYITIKVSANNSATYA